MKCTRVHEIYFSATGTTGTYTNLVAAGTCIEPGKRFDVTCGEAPAEEFGEDELVVFGMPVYAGRIPDSAARRLQTFQGHNTPAIALCVYGNREYEDALLELCDLAAARGFRIVSAAAFIAQHAIFPVVAAGRPDEEDKAAAAVFARESIRRLDTVQTAAAIPAIEVPGNRPYRETKPIPLHPAADRKCNRCGVCAQRCPAGAIPVDMPKRTDKARCIACGRCVRICPRRARRFRGLPYALVARKFRKRFSMRKEPSCFYAV